MKTLLVFLILTGLVIADALPDMPMNKIPSGNSTVPDHEINIVQSNLQPVWKDLETMSISDRANSQIEIELGSGAGRDAKYIALSIENLWNSGQYSAALALFDDLSKLIDPSQIAIGNSWRVPVPTQETALWGTDVRIGNRESLTLVAFDVHRASGNLFAVLGGPDGDRSKWYVNISTNGGNTWSETYEWFSAAGEGLNSMSAAVVGDYCYVGYTALNPQVEGRIRRFSAATGAMDVAFGWETIFSVIDPEYVKEINISTNQEVYNNRIYCMAITSTGDLRYFWDTASDGASWSEISTGITNADRGVDATFCGGDSARYFYVSYYDTNDSLCILGEDSVDWYNLLKVHAGASADYTAISAYNDMIICAFDRSTPSFTCEYRISRDGGESWSYGTLDSATYGMESPDVTAKMGAGLAVTYRYYTDFREERFAHRNYDPGIWPDRATISDRQPYWNKPAIEYIGGGAYGIVFLSWNTTPVRAAYFDKGTSGCPYILGDINGNGAANGIDVTYGVVYFKGGPPPPVSCPSCPETAPFYAAGDVNGNCVFNGIDISYYVVYLKGGPALHSCADCPPAGSALEASIPRDRESQTKHDNSSSISGE
jgi:hypothetical protein